MTQALIVTTAQRGVFFGYGNDTDEKTITLISARMCIFWSADVKGVMGLAATGPTAGCRVGPEVPAITLRDVTAVIEVSQEAKEAWEKEPWAATAP